jgi:hypothetical protein
MSNIAWQYWPVFLPLFALCLLAFPWHARAKKQPDRLSNP